MTKATECLAVIPARGGSKGVPRKNVRDLSSYAPELVMLLQCTSPLTQAKELDGLVAELFEQNADSAFTAVPFCHFLWGRDAEGKATGINHAGAKRKRRQELAPQFLESGAAY